MRATGIDENMKRAAAGALAGCVSPENLDPKNILPAAMDMKIVPEVAAAVASAAMESGLARKEVEPDRVKQMTENSVHT